MINILGMNFPDDTSIDIGSMKVNKTNDCLILAGTDIDKLDSVLTRSVCIGTYNADRFSFDSGDIAFAPDVSRLFMYESATDTWYEQEI